MQHRRLRFSLGQLLLLLTIAGLLLAAVSRLAYFARDGVWEVTSLRDHGNRGGMESTKPLVKRPVGVQVVSRAVCRDGDQYQLFQIAVIDGLPTEDEISAMVSLQVGDRFRVRAKSIPGRTSELFDGTHIERMKSRQVKKPGKAG